MHFQEFEKNGTTHCQVVDHFVLSALSSVSSARGSGWVGGWVSEQRRHTGALPTIVCKFKFLLHQIYRQWPALLLMDECVYIRSFSGSQRFIVWNSFVLLGSKGWMVWEQRIRVPPALSASTRFGLVWYKSASVQEQEQVSANYLWYRWLAHQSYCCWIVFGFAITTHRIFEIKRLKDAQLLVFIENVPWFRKVDIANLPVCEESVCLYVCLWVSGLKK